MPRRRTRLGKGLEENRVQADSEPWRAAAWTVLGPCQSSMPLIRRKDLCDAHCGQVAFD